MTIRNTQVQTINTQIFKAVGQQAVTTIVFCNVTTVTTTVNLFAVPLGGSPGITTQVLNGVVLPGGETFAMDSERFVLEDEDALYAQSDVNNAVTVTISSVSTT